MARHIHHPDEVAKCYKYTIWRRFEDFTVAEKKLAMIRLPEKLGKDLRTIENWMYIKHGDNKSVPADCLLKLASFFGVEIEKMWTIPLESLWLDRLEITNACKS